MGFNLENYNFELLLQTLQPEKIIYLVKALLLERKVVLIKRDVGDIAVIMQALIALMNPFTWHFTTITYLTADMVEFLEAPVPYLIGVSTHTWEHIARVMEYPDDIIIFDLESQERRKFLSSANDLPPLPHPYGEELLAEFRDIINRKERWPQMLRREKPSLSRAESED